MRALVVRAGVAAAVVSLAVVLAACAASSEPTDSLTKADARDLAGKGDTGVDLCEEQGWYGDRECDDFCVSPDPDCTVRAETAGDGTLPLGDGTLPLGNTDAGPQTDDPDSGPDAGPEEPDSGPDAGPEEPDSGPDAGPEEPDSGPDSGPAERNCGGFAGLTCESNEYCDYLGSSCGWADQLGVCRTRPESCIEIYMPVCGCDGLTHSNACDANAAGADVRLSGECPL